MDWLNCLFATSSSSSSPTLSFSVLAILSLVLPGVSAVSDRIPVIASSAVALFMFLILIIVIVFATCYAQSWVKSSMKKDGKVKMPRSYFAKKREARSRLVAESTRSSRVTQDTYVSRQPSKPGHPLLNGNPTLVVPPADKETMVQGWNQGTRRIYEEKGYTMELGDENEEEFHIETTIVDNEVLDVGPYKNMESTTARPVDGNVYSNNYLYTNNDRATADRVTVTRSSNHTGVVSSGGDLHSTSAKTSGDYSNFIIPDVLPNSMDDKVIKL